MNVFFHGTIEAGFDVLEAKIQKDMVGPMSAWISEYLLADLGSVEVMCAMNCTNMEESELFGNTTLASLNIHQTSGSYIDNPALLSLR